MDLKKKTGHCIICHRDDFELSDEHVIPDSIGGYYHIYSVCKECNSKLGNNVDNLLLKHWLIQGARHLKHLPGKTGKIPNPLIGDGMMEDGSKVRMEEDKSGVLIPHLIPSSPHIAEDGKSFTFCVDRTDEKLIPKTVQKMMKKMGKDSSSHEIKSERRVMQIENPLVTMKINLDLKNYKIGLLKIAYEFAVDKIPEYYNDKKARVYSEILHSANLNRLDEVEFEGDGIICATSKPLEEYIDYSNTDRHILMLLNIDGKLYCLVKLFEKTFCQMIRMSDKAYGDEGLIMLAVNDYNKKECKFYSQQELIEACPINVQTIYQFSKEADKIIKAEEGTNEIGLACNMYNSNILYNKEHIPICTQENLIENLENQGCFNTEKAESKITTTYPITDELYLCMMPSDKLLRIEKLMHIAEFCKI